MKVHEHIYHLCESCGVGVCVECEDHKGLARCYCGWSADGGDGYAQLVEMGEPIEDY
jgi:hypothetical protein